MNIDDRLASLDAALLDTSIHLLNTRVGGLETVEELLESGRKAVVSLDGVGEEGIATSLRGIEDVQESSARRLLLVCNVRVPSN